MHGLPAETQIIGSAGVQVLDKNISLLDKVGQNLLAVRSLAVKRQ